MRIAIVGTGISGLVCAHLLDPDHDVTVFEAGSYVGGHTNTVDVEVPGPDGTPEHHAVDTGFIVFNERNYPNFIRLLDRLDVASQPSEMSFSVQQRAQRRRVPGHQPQHPLRPARRNLLSPSFSRMLVDILRFNRQARRLVADRRATAARLARRVRRPRAATRDRFRERVPGAPRRLDLVGRPRDLPRVPRRGLLPVHGQPRPAGAAGPPHVAHRHRRLAAVRAGPHRPPAPARAHRRRRHQGRPHRRRRPAPRHRRRGRHRQPRSRDLRRGDPRRPLRPDASSCWAIPPPPSRRSWAPSATSPTWPPCTPTRACFPASTGPGPAGTTTSAPDRAGRPR